MTNFGSQHVLELLLRASVAHNAGNLAEREACLDEIKRRGVIVPRPAKEEP